MSDPERRMYNCHTHVFTNLHVPERLLPFGLVPWLRLPGNRAFAVRAARLLNPVLNTYHRLFGVPHANNRVTRLASLLEVAGVQTQDEVFGTLVRQYPAGTRFVTLSIDMDFMGAGRPQRDFLSQVTELAHLKWRWGDLIRPFLGVDPRRPGLLDLVRRAHEELGFEGLKLYPALGFLPDDPALTPVYAYAQEHDLPVVSHCSKGGLTFQGRLPRVHPRTGAPLGGITRAEYARLCSHPANFESVLTRFPELRVCLAHFGGAGEWRAYLEGSRRDDDEARTWLEVISDMMRAHGQLYTDLSYTTSEVSLTPLAKVLVNTPHLRERVLFGTDFYVVQAETTEREFSVRLRGALGEQDFWQIANRNPRSFLRRSGSAASH